MNFPDTITDLIMDHIFNDFIVDMERQLYICKTIRKQITCTPTILRCMIAGAAFHSVPKKNDFVSLIFHVLTLSESVFFVNGL